MLSYAGITLADCRPDLAAWIATNINSADVYQFQDSTWPGQGRQGWAYPGHVNLPSPIKINSLYWPRGASQWAFAHVIANDEMLEAIKEEVYAGGELAAADLVIDDGTNDPVETAMYMLPPRPLAQIAADNAIDKQLYLVTLVDERFFWWYKGGDLTDVASWDELYTAAASALGISIDADAVDAAYLLPSKSLAKQYDYLPLLLDAIAYNVGHRIVRKLDGTVSAQSYDTAKASLDAQLALGYKVHSGGILAHADKAAMAPQGTLMLFPQQASEIWCGPDGVDKNVTLPTGSAATESNTLAGLGLTDYSGIVGFDGTKVWHNQAIKGTSNATELAGLAAKFSTDWYNWQLGSLDTVFTGIIPWEPEGLHHSVEWFIDVNPDTGIRHLGTRIQRPPWNDLADRLNHKSSYGTIDTTDGIAHAIDATETLDDTLAFSGSVMYVDKFISRDVDFQNLTVSNLTVLCGVDLQPCDGTFSITVYDVRCEHGDQNKYAIVYSLAYVDGCLTITGIFESFVARIGYCKVCDDIEIVAFMSYCNPKRSVLEQYRVTETFSSEQGCYVSSGIKVLYHSDLLCNITCCSSSSSSGSGSSSASSSSSSSACQQTDCGGPVDYTCSLYGGTAYDWIPDEFADPCTYVSTTLTLGPCGPGNLGEVKTLHCPCCGVIIWKWNGAGWDQFSGSCTGSGTAVAPTGPGPPGDFPYTATLCYCPCPSSSSGSSGSTSPGDDEGCCNCGFDYPNTWLFELSTIAGTGCTSGACTDTNGTYLLNLQSETCRWECSNFVMCAVTANVYLYCDATNWILEFFLQAAYVKYTLPLASWDCADVNVMNKVMDTSILCSGFPATLELTPA